jgi:hypothetical protein
MKRMLIKFFIMVFIGCLQTSSMAAHYDSVITGQGDPEADILAVRKAVDQGGAVLLKGTFDFGKNGKVHITKDINISGETDAQGDPVTKIKGGLWTFHSPLPTQLPPTEPGPMVTIRNIHFEGALWAPINLPYCGGATIVNNKITNVRPMAYEKPMFGKEGMYNQQGIIFVPLYTLPEESGIYQPGLVTGKIAVADNDIDLSTNIPEKTMSQGVLMIGATGAKTLILRNRVVNCTRNSIESIDNYPGEDGSGMTLIKGNTIITAEKGIPLPSPFTPNGIIGGWFLDLKGASDPARKTRLIITDNHIETRGETSIGVAILSDGAVIDSNHMILKGTQSMGIFHANSEATITNNTIEGTGTYAVMFSPFQQLNPCRNVIMNNDYTRFKASTADVVLQGSSNVLLEKSSKIVDEGQTNLILE